MEAPRAPRSATLLPVVLGLVAVVFAMRPIDDFDVWYHLAAARLMWTTGTWPATNTFSSTAPDHAWIDLHWVFQLLLYAFYGLGGANGCIALVAVLLLTTVAVLYVLSRRFVPPAAAALLLAVALAVSSPRFVPRPELLSFALLAAFLAILDRQPRTGRWLYLLVPLQILWTNSQGIFAIGLALIACYWLGATLAFLPLPRGWREESGCSAREWRTLTIVLVLASAGAFVNPYGLDGVLFPLQLLPRVTGSSLFKLRIGEFRGPFESGYAVPLTYAWTAMLALTGGSFLLNFRRVHLGRLFAAAVFGYLGTQTLRNMALFAWIAVPVIAATLGTFVRRTLAAPASRRAPSLVRRLGGPRWRLAANASTIALLLALAASVVTNHFSSALQVDYTFGLGVSPLRFSPAAADFAREVGITGRAFNCLAIGGFLIWERPEDRVLVDGRLEAYPEPVFAEYFRVIDDPALFTQLAAKYRPDYVFIYHIWPNRLPLVSFLAAGHGWKLVYYDEGISIFVPADEAHSEVLDRAQRRFGAILEQRRAASEREPSALDAIVVPLNELWGQRSYGNLLRTLGRYDEASLAYRHALVIAPDDPELRFNLGLAYWYGGKQTQAVREWRDVVRRAPAYAPATRALRDAGAAASPPT